MSLSVWLSGPTFHPGGGSAWRGVCLQGVCFRRMVGQNIPPPPGTRKVGGTHPTGMLSRYVTIVVSRVT